MRLRAADTERLLHAGARGVLCAAVAQQAEHRKWLLIGSHFLPNRYKICAGLTPTDMGPVDGGTSARVGSLTPLAVPLLLKPR
jgi:hypothetical protein